MLLLILFFSTASLNEINEINLKLPIHHPSVTIYTPWQTYSQEFISGGEDANFRLNLSSLYWGPSHCEVGINTIGINVSRFENGTHPEHYNAFKNCLCQWIKLQEMKFHNVSYRYILRYYPCSLSVVTNLRIASRLLISYGECNNNIIFIFIF